MKIRFIVLLATLLLPAFVQSAEQVAPTAVKRIGVEEYDKLRADTDHVILDVRSAAEFEMGRIPRAINLDINAKARKKLETTGFRELHDLGPGFDGWKQAGKPIEK